MKTYPLDSPALCHCLRKAGNTGKGELTSITVQQADGSFLTISEHDSPIERHNNSIRLPERYPTQARIQLLTPCASNKKARFCAKPNLRKRFSCANFCAVI
ncbi:hypothetical protein [Neisseria flavescens]|uniref:hypothetical protein n=1 Tax=Neisseria flavescens TaxID=484 RepID=UPI0024B23E94|nr:hypothetical protein [Neisseria flavescens]